MGELVSKMNLSEARSKLTQLDKLLKPGEALQINKRGKAYARIELIGETDRYDRVLNSINGLPEPKNKLRAVAQNYKSILYGSNNANLKRL
jgi:antitoxin (DNA-binding transcriptional repressor) of toxin-antitoxin stability system